MNLKLKAALSGLALFISSVANAGLISYTDEQQWNNAVGTLTGTEDFNGFGVDNSFSDMAVIANNMRISWSEGGPPNVSWANKIDAPTFELDTYSIDNTSFLFGNLRAHSFSRNAETIRIDLLDPVSAWGATFNGISNGDRNTNISVFDTSGTLLGAVSTSSSTTNEIGFYGFSLGAKQVASYLILENSVFATTDLFGIDNVGFKVANATSISEPSTIAIFALGVLGLASRRYKN